ncbi:MAG: hypothetical protein ABSA92_00180 [Candidatus Bathyarchaeia archaeon]|jgi:hypothetical protein
MVRLFAEMDWVVTVIKLVALVLGAFIVYLAYKGYKRNISKPLLYVALGFALITAATVVEGILYVIIGSDLLVALFISTIITVVGFVAIIYSVYSVK